MLAKSIKQLSTSPTRLKTTSSEGSNNKNTSGSNKQPFSFVSKLKSGTHRISRQFKVVDDDHDLNSNNNNNNNIRKQLSSTDQSSFAESVFLPNDIILTNNSSLPFIKATNGGTTTTTTTTTTTATAMPGLLQLPTNDNCTYDTNSLSVNTPTHDLSRKSSCNSVR